MKILISFIFILFCCFLSAQKVTFNTIEKVNNNQDKFFYRIDTIYTEAEYLAEIDIQGFTDNDTELFGELYKKAKEVGANAFMLKKSETIDGSIAKFDPFHYQLQLFYLPKEIFPHKENWVYVISSSEKPQKIQFNDDYYIVQPRSYFKKKIPIGDLCVISTKKFLGSTIQFLSKKNQNVQYFQISSLKVRSNSYGEPGINFKSGDIVLLERSFAEFLTVIYKDMP